LKWQQPFQMTQEHWSLF